MYDGRSEKKIGCVVLQVVQGGPLRGTPCIATPAIRAGYCTKEGEQGRGRGRSSTPLDPLECIEAEESTQSPVDSRSIDLNPIALALNSTALRICNFVFCFVLRVNEDEGVERWPEGGGWGSMASVRAGVIGRQHRTPVQRQNAKRPKVSIDQQKHVYDASCINF